jgi:hypothetical protein
MALEELAECVRTSDERDMFAEGIFQTKRALSGSPKAPEVKALFLDLFNADSASLMYRLYQGEGAQNLDAFITRVEAMVLGWPQIRLSLAIRPTERLIKKLHDWLIYSLGEVVVIEFQYEPQLLAGAVMEWQGRYRDYSLLTKLNTNIKREFIEKILKNKHD